MTGRRVDLNLGLVSLPLGEDRRQGEHESPAQRQADPDDVARLQAVLGREAPAQAADGTPAQPETGGAPPSRLTPGMADGDGHARTGAEIERLWVANGALGLREVRLRMRRDILPDTTLRIFESGARLQIELYVGCEATRRWLAADLPVLARTLGRRLRHPLHLLVSGVGAAQPAVTCIDWSEEHAR